VAETPFLWSQGLESISEATDRMVAAVLLHKALLAVAATSIHRAP
jgi:hypothetical protein